MAFFLRPRFGLTGSGSLSRLVFNTQHEGTVEIVISEDSRLRKWSDIDFDNKYLTVMRSVAMANKEVYLKETKTKKGRRRIDSTPWAQLQLLRAVGG